MAILTPTRHPESQGLHGSPKDFDDGISMISINHGDPGAREEVRKQKLFSVKGEPCLS